MSKSILDQWSIKSAYDKLHNLPMGSSVFNCLIGWMVPYTGSIKPKVEILSSGYSLVSMNDRRPVRNHLKSVHAVALMNLGEAATGLALLYDLPADLRGILTKLSMEYIKKARGRLHAEGRCEMPTSKERKEYIVTAHIYDESKTVVAKATATWLVGPKT
jgi:acyl-coenzyme A thioesterase PaaI-like protein